MHLTSCSGVEGRRLRQGLNEQWGDSDGGRRSEVAVAGGGVDTSLGLGQEGC